MGYNSKTQTFDTSPELRDRLGKNGASATVLGYYAVGDFGASVTYTYSDSSTLDDDGGIVFKPDSIDSGDPGRWLLNYTQPINVLWFGLKAADSGFDNLALYNAMIAAAPNIPVTPNTGYNMKGMFLFPMSASSYYFSGTLEIYDTISFFGQCGTDSFLGTNFLFPVNTIGIFVHSAVDSPAVRGSFSFTMMDISLNSTISTDTTKPGLKANRPIRLENCNVRGFSGGGYFIDTSVEGIADLFSIINCAAYYNGESGLMTKGIDSNQGTVINFNSFGNMRWGIDDNSFLGNQYIGCHTNVNGGVPNNPVWAFLSGVTYVCIKNHTNKEPGVAGDWETYWLVVVTGIVAPSEYYPAWSSSFAYKTGGAYNSLGSVPGVNASNWYGCYSEGGQPPSAFDTYNMVYGGDHGAGFRNPKTTGLITGNGGAYSTSQFWWRIPQSFNQTATQEFVVDANGIELFPSDNGVRGGGFALRWINDLKFFGWQYRNTEIAQWITTQLSDPSFYGRSVSPAAIPQYPQGFFLGKNDDYPRARMIELSAAAPTFGEHGIGDIAFKTVTGPGDNVIGWHCVVAGTPGTWEEFVSGATVNVVDGTPTNTVTPTGWFKTSIEGVDAWLPYYQ